MIREWKQKTPARNRLRLRQIKALYPARVRIGIGDNFIDRSTPLVALNFVAFTNSHFNTAVSFLVFQI